MLTLKKKKKYWAFPKSLRVFVSCSEFNIFQAVNLFYPNNDFPLSRMHFPVTSSLLWVWCTPFYKHMRSKTFLFPNPRNKVLSIIVGKQLSDLTISMAETSHFQLNSNNFWNYHYQVRVYVFQLFLYLIIHSEFFTEKSKCR